MNKMFKKIFAVVAACATVATMSISAFAAGETASHEAGSVSVNGYAAVSGATQYTVMVFEDSFTGTEVDKIFYINQGSDPATLLAGMLVKGGELGVGDYTVRIGNDKGTTTDVKFSVEAVVNGYKITGYVADAYATVTIGETTVEVAEDGSFTFADFANGAYSLIVKAPGAYAKTLAATVNGADVVVSTSEAKTALAYGDVNDEGKTTFDGLSKLIAAYDAKTNEANYVLACDFDRNGTVDFDDLSKLIANYDKSTAQVYAE